MIKFCLVNNHIPGSLVVSCSRPIIFLAMGSSIAVIGIIVGISGICCAIKRTQRSGQHACFQMFIYNIL